MVTRGKNVFAKQVGMSRSITDPTSIPKVNDLLLHALFARIAMSNNSTIEFQTEYNKETNTIELIIPEKATRIFDQMVGMQRGPKFTKFMDWLIGSKRLETAVQPNFISSTAFDIFLGATIATLNDRVVIIFPGVDPSIIGYNLKLKTLGEPIPVDQDNPCCVLETPDPTQSIKLYMLWQFICGNNSQLELRVTANIMAPSQAPYSIINDVIISTAGLSPADVVETEILELDDLPSDTIISLNIQRNFSGSGDPHSEMIGMIGMRVENV